MKGLFSNSDAGEGWNRIPTPPGEERMLCFGGSRLWILRRETGWALALQSAGLSDSFAEHGLPHEGDLSYGPGSKPEEIPWSDYYVDDPEDWLTAELSLPDKPIAAHPLQPILLPDGEKALFTTPIPLELHLKTARMERELIKVPSMILSKSLFGEPDTGEIVYSSPLEVYHRDAEIIMPGYCARCDMRVLNISGGLLDFSRVCIRVEYLGLYREGRACATDEIIFAFRGAEQASSLSFSRRSESPDCQRLSSPRIAGYGNLIRKSFDFFRSLASY
jgi:hypothetical protein